MDAKERLQLMDHEGTDKAILYPTLGILWEAEVSVQKQIAGENVKQLYKL